MTPNSSLQYNPTFSRTMRLRATEDFLSGNLHTTIIVGPVRDRVWTLLLCTAVNAFFMLAFTFELAIM